MTTYTLTIGYCPCRCDYKAMWDELKDIVAAICISPTVLVEEAKTTGSPPTCDDGCCDLRQYAEAYMNLGDQGCPVQIIEGTEEDESDPPRIYQMASTADEIKYHVRRAFVRLVLKRAHAKNIELNLSVG